MRLPVDFIIQLQMFICSIFRIDQVQALGRFSENWFVVGSRCRFISRCHLLFHIFVQNQIQKGAVNKINNFLDSFSIFFKNNITDAVNDPFFMFCEPGNDKMSYIIAKYVSLIKAVETRAFNLSLPSDVCNYEYFICTLVMDRQQQCRPSIFSPLHQR